MCTCCYGHPIWSKLVIQLARLLSNNMTNPIHYNILISNPILGVGKTSLVTKYVTKTNPKELSPTIGASFFSCRITIEDIRVNMQVWDTAGQEKFRSMAPMYYRGANAAILVFDLNNYSSFVDIKTWITELQRTVVDQIVMTLVGNKADLPERSVSKEEVK